MTAPPSLVKHAGLSPSDNASGAFYGEARISVVLGRPGLRLDRLGARVWPLLTLINPVMAAKYQRDDPGRRHRCSQAAAAQADAGSRQVSGAAAAARARRAKARVACAASLLRWIYSMVVHDTSWDPAVAASTRATGMFSVTSRRQPDQRFVPHPPRCPRPSSPLRGRASPPSR